MKRKENISMARNPYASAEESLSVMSEQKATAAHLEVLRLIEERGMNEQGVSNAKYVSGIVDVCAAVVKQRNELLEVLKLIANAENSALDLAYCKGIARAEIAKAAGVANEN